MKGDVQATIQNGDSLITIGDSGGVSPFGPKKTQVDTYVGDTKKQFANRKFMTNRMFETADTVLEIVDGMRARGQNPDNAFNNIAGQAIGPATNLLLDFRLWFLFCLLNYSLKLLFGVQLDLKIGCLPL